MQKSIVGLTVGLVAFFALVTGAVHYFREAQHLMEMAQERLQTIAVTAAAALDGDAHGELNRCLDRRCPNYLKLSAYLKQVQSQNGLSTEVYTLAREGDRTRFVLRTRQEGAIGQYYDLRPLMLDVYERGNPAVTGVYRDEYGTWISAYAPVKDSLGRTVALLEADYKASEIIAMIGRDAVELGAIGVAGLVLTLLLTLRLSRKLTRPLEELREAVDAAAEGDIAYPVPLDAPHEIGVLAKHFAGMRDDLQSMHRQERLALVGRMASSLLHDMGGPLMNLNGLAHLMAHSAEESARLTLNRRILAQVDRIQAMGREVLDFASGEVRLIRSEIRPDELLAVVREDLASMSAGLRVTVELKQDCRRTVWGDQERLRRLLFNLVRNAIEASPPDGIVHLGAESDCERWTLTVQDQGPGIAGEMAGRLFEPFATHGKARGTGLGLAVVKSVAEAHGGDISVESFLGRGTTFRVRLPTGEPQEPS